MNRTLNVLDIIAAAERDNKGKKITTSSQLKVKAHLKEALIQT